MSKPAGFPYIKIFAAIVVFVAIVAFVSDNDEERAIKRHIKRYGEWKTNTVRGNTGIEEHSATSPLGRSIAINGEDLPYRQFGSLTLACTTLRTWSGFPKEIPNYGPWLINWSDPFIGRSPEGIYKYSLTLRWIGNDFLSTHGDYEITDSDKIEVVSRRQIKADKKGRYTAFNSATILSPLPKKIMMKVITNSFLWAELPNDMILKINLVNSHKAIRETLDKCEQSL